MDTELARPRGAADLLAVGFGTTVAMWALAYFCRLCGDAVPAALVFGLMLAAQLGGGLYLGRTTPRGLGGGALAGLLTGLLNLLIVGSLISSDTPNEIRRGALMWIPGTLGVGLVLGGLGAAIGSTLRRTDTPASIWPGRFAAVDAVATFVLLAAGGLVTGYDEGLAVVDWPNSEGYNMFLYPLAKMSGSGFGRYLEHSHRLLGSLVGLTTLVVAIHTQLTEHRRWVKALGWTALLFVIFQGILGGLRVTGRFTLSTQPADTDPKVLLAIVHGVFGQIVFGTLVGLAVVRSHAWLTAPAPQPAPAVSTDRTFNIALVVLLVVQLVLGALVRHFSWALDILRYGLAVNPQRLQALGERALHIHLTVAVVVLLLGVAVGVRAWGLYSHVPVLPRLGRTFLVLAGVQLALGIAALIATGNDAVQRQPQVVDVIVTTAHQVIGAALLAWAVMLLIWNYRLLAPVAPAARG
jgi:cytochrome c oxidase assembly protein subunit 15